MKRLGIQYFDAISNKTKFDVQYFHLRSPNLYRLEDKNLG